MGTTCGHTTLTPNYTRITTRDAHTTGITDIEFTTGTIAIITIAIELSGWRSLSKRFFTEVRPRKDHRGVDLMSDALPFGRLWYGGPDADANAVGYATHRSQSHDALIRAYDEAGNVIETHQHAGEFKEPWGLFSLARRLDVFGLALLFGSFSSSQQRSFN
jgi:hypothetical protein